ncbi:MAG: threonine/serine dehydratase [Flavobacteriaceae bacterium]|nr:threonine/serine dehydratase [Flavobacteriaceae bacterium]MDH3796004.1 threonine/serine dehydratase [Flavobacteriaceae bacterium]
MNPFKTTQADPARISDAWKLIEPHVHQTPVLTSTLFNEWIGTKVYFKPENLQKTGSYKIRGATHAILRLSEDQRKKGVVTHSSGNFAQALSLAAKNMGIPAYIVMPINAPAIKQEAVKGYEGIITSCEPTLEARESAASKIIEQTGATFIHPSNDLQVILGQGTAAYELLKEVSDLKNIIAPVGGGGLLAGTSLAAKQLSPHCEVIGAEPYEVDDAYRSLISGKIETNETTNTIADGLRTQLGDVSFPIIKEHVSKIIRVEEDEIKKAMMWVWERMKIVIEPSSAVAVAAVIKERHLFQKGPIGIVISGGNTDVSHPVFTN